MDSFVVELYAGGAMVVISGPFGWHRQAEQYGKRCLGATAAAAAESALVTGVDGEVQHAGATCIDQYRVAVVEPDGTAGRVLAEGTT